MSKSTAETEFFAAIGGVIDSWQLVEIRLSNLFATCMRSPDERVGPEVFYAVQNFRDKLAMVNAAVKFTLWGHKNLLPEWTILHSAIDKKSKRRNRIVHAHTWPLDEATKELKLGPHLTLSSYIEAEANPQKSFITIAHLLEASKSFKILQQRIGAFDERVRAFLAAARLS